MKKLSLKLDELEVESFTTHGSGGRGTVDGQSIFEPSGLTYCIQCGSGGFTESDCYGESRCRTCDPVWQECQPNME